MRLPAARPIPVASTTASIQVSGGLLLVVGWAFWEPTGAAACTFKLWSGTATAGTLVAPISLATGESTRDLIPGDGLEVISGLFLEVVTGRVEGSVWAREATLEGGVAFADGAIPWPSGEL